MSPEGKKVLKRVGAGFLLCLSALLVLDSGRLTGCFLFVVLLVALLSFSLHGRRRRYVYAVWALFFIAMLIPVDIRFGHTAGRPRVMSVSYGLSPKTPEEMRRANEVSGGCVVPILPLKWVVVL